jgi:hypothetical protein
LNFIGTLILNDAPPNSLKDSNTSSKAKIIEEEGIRVRSLAHNISEVRRVCYSFGMGIRTSDKWVSYLDGLAQTKQVG